MLKKLTLVFLLLCTVIYVESYSSFSLITTARGVGIGGYWELSEKYYPKTILYFEGLKEKYPILTNFNILILAGPMADIDTIYFPMDWIEELEKGNTFYRDMTEWIILHEIGHIVHKDGLKALGSIAAMYMGYIGAIFYGNQATRAYSYEERQSSQMKTVLSFWVSVTGLVSLICFMSTQEYGADDYAMDCCDNPAAWIAAYEFLDRKAPLGFLPGVFHSFTKYRLDRIEKTFKEKFGYALEFTPQSLYPEYID